MGHVLEFDAEEALRAFKPARLARDRFAAVEALVREATRACSPATSARARDYLRFASYLATWCESEHLPLRIDSVFAADTVEEFVAVLEQGLPSRSVATIASVLRSMSTMLASPLVVDRRVHPARQPKSPYDPDETAELFSCAERSRSRKRRHDLAALLILCLATGASGQEAALVRPQDIMEHDGVVVTLRRARQDGTVRSRRVLALERYRQQLIQLRNSAGEFLIGGGTTRHSRVYDLCEGSRGARWPVELDPSRARATYLVEIATTPNTVTELLSMAGVTTLEVFNDLLPYLRAREVSTDLSVEDPLFAL